MLSFVNYQQQSKSKLSKDMPQSDIISSSQSKFLEQKIDILSKHTKHISESTSLKQMFTSLNNAIKTIFKAESVYVLLHDKTLIQSYS